MPADLIDVIGLPTPEQVRRILSLLAFGAADQAKSSDAA